MFKHTVPYEWDYHYKLNGSCCPPTPSPPSPLPLSFNFFFTIKIENVHAGNNDCCEVKKINVVRNGCVLCFWVSEGVFWEYYGGRKGCARNNYIFKKKVFSNKSRVATMRILVCPIFSTVGGGFNNSCFLSSFFRNWREATLQRQLLPSVQL